MINLPFVIVLSSAVNGRLRGIDEEISGTEGCRSLAVPCRAMGCSSRMIAGSYIKFVLSCLVLLVSLQHEPSITEATVTICFLNGGLPHLLRYTLHGFHHGSALISQGLLQVPAAYMPG